MNARAIVSDCHSRVRRSAWRYSHQRYAARDIRVPSDRLMLAAAMTRSGQLASHTHVSAKSVPSPMKTSVTGKRSATAFISDFRRAADSRRDSLPGFGSGGRGEFCSIIIPML